MKPKRVIILAGIALAVILLAALYYFFPVRRTILRATGLFFLLSAIWLSVTGAALPFSGFSFKAASRRLLLPLLVLLTTAAALPFLRLARLNLGSPLFIISHWEKTLYFQALEFSSTGELFYRSPETLPLISDAYPPLFPVLAGLLFKVAPPTPLVPKLLSLAAFLGTAGLLFAVFGKSRLAGTPLLLGSFVFLTVSIPGTWLWARTDALVSFLTFAFLTVLAAPPRKERAAAAGLLWLLAVFTKQTALFWLPFILAVIYLRGKKLKTAAGFAAAAVAAAAVVFILIEARTQSWYSFWTVSVPGRHPYQLPARLAVLTAFRLTTRLGVVPGALILSAFLSSRGDNRDGFRDYFRKNRELGYWTSAAVYGVAISTLSALKTGTAYNQYQDVFAPLAAASALFFASLTGYRRTGGRDAGPSPGLPAAGYGLLFAAILFSFSHYFLQARAEYSQVRFNAGVHRTEDLKALAGEIEERGWAGVYFPMSSSPDRSTHLLGVQEYFAVRTGFGAYADEGALMDLQAAGYPFPAGFANRLRLGEVERIVVKSNHLPFKVPNGYAGIPGVRCDPDIFPTQIRDAFNRYYRKVPLETPGFDAYEHIGRRREEPGRPRGGRS